ncbi:hypothetical protein CcaverHIS002_0607180 [Cutaneotrichosporon cavernicola]|uniref:Nucleoporin protein Ndc1-Nup n=1 Tax=Cutaneotrichosporon cavernicola TaxID=279322 RepID=A0AA48QYA8_9TREE|nr:uncharacterized protein CcaverHIS019_0606600 [Cutaneotrichosporon cavernicola]BEI86431.1 hypothetical protein CcaverHIS002_0607180 [Cutaneotrichosporon cavernicola]BEI94201.1 hypothetical protein CcaverHIS019_0606600 [Cutaneotrichosporon cavernicola]BEJ01981.1 hypothetical protein CcaverHIS631_0606630 [Cutaneotrichosporon cavernicola]BEJ09744.1 hypothetical protein CcaverHIS641_0606590 [Cutaneotrichosporon cavernicola]
MSTTLQPAKAPVSPLVRIDAHYRKALAFRWQELVIRAFFVTAVSFLLVPAVLLGWRPSLLTFSSLLFTTPIIYLLTTHIVLRSRRSWIESPPLLPASPSALSVWFGTFSHPVLALLAAQASAAIFFALAFAGVQNHLYPSSGLGWSSASTPRYPWHWNERLWFLVFGNTVFFGLLALRDVLVGNVGPKWPQSRAAFPVVIQRALGQLFTAGPSSLIAELANAAQFTVVYTLVYFTLRRSVWRMAVTYLPFLRPFALNFAKKGSLSWGLAYYLLVLQITGLFALKPALAVVNDYLCQPLPFPSFTRKSPLSADKYLLTALESTNAFYLGHTMVELQRAAHSVKRRKEIFADASRPALVHELFRALLLVLGDSYSTLAAKGRKLSSAPLAPVPPVHDGLSMPVKAGDIFRPVPKPGALQGFVSTVLEGKPAPTPAPVRAALDRAHAAEVAVAKKVETDVPVFERWVGGTPFLSPVLAGVKLARGGFSAWAGREWSRRAVAAAVPEPDRLARIVDILATFCVAAYDEDEYGSVQAVLPSTLEALVRVRGAALALGADLVTTAPKVSSSAADAARADCAAVAAIAENGIRRIADRFSATLTAFRFPTGIATALTDVCK